MKKGIFLGSFDPIHLGHFLAVMRSLKDFDEITIMPTPQNPCKKEKATPLEIRVKMCEEAFKGFPNIKVDVGNIEALKGKYYTYLQIRDYAGKGYSIICGTDLIKKISRWRNYSWISKNFDLYEIKRPGYCDENEEHLIQMSSTEIRKMIKENNPKYKEYLHETTVKIIEENKLYSS